MVEVSAYGIRVLDRINMILMFIVHLINLAQVTVLFIHRLVYGCIPLFEIASCSIFPFLVSCWHITYLLFYIVMLKRCLILESSRHSRLIQIIGIVLILVRFADWPYELTFHNIQAQMEQPIESGQTCWATWGSGVLILNFIGDTLANLFLSGLFVRRLFKHLKVRTNMIVNQRSQLVEYIARKSLAFTPLFEIIESTLLVEALRVDHENLHSNHFCESCGFIIAASTLGDGTGRTRRKSSIVRVLSGSQLKDMAPALNEVSKPEESFTVSMNSIHHDRHELHHRPEWNNNDYRMF
ncbi:hypothetical protein K450DRAFT_292817 [Umbelopsis ramanniana AG]|uniref:Uncharacterized protein n=1 Tax=Umbelopsis ramanniana AG TaxID=1314678 RepID=A0AAD5EET7_UMBRA|nr:uncharacterized protein K450DRAFT_292817 [Umbelopsis ramanniana AG]KAI8582568.1 hypothetical protein K450DRAFT_292817 [Umbelopsis ramanniana AG]